MWTGTLGTKLVKGQRATIREWSGFAMWGTHEEARDSALRTAEFDHRQLTGRAETGRQGSQHLYGRFD